MMELAYPAARLAARRVHSYFARHQLASGGARTAAVPDVADIEAVIDAAFWASLRREEGYIAKMSLATLSQADTTAPIAFEHPLPMTTETLVRVSPAVERPGLHLAVARQDGELVIWGTVRAIPASVPVVEVIAQGLIVVKHRPDDDSGKFVNVAVLEGDQVKVLDEQSSSLADCPEEVTPLLGFGSPAFALGSSNVLVALAVSMRAHGRGGSLLVVPSDGEEWRLSIVHPMRYAVHPRFHELADLVRAGEEGRGFGAPFDRAVDAIAGLTAVDGATLLTERYELIAFGAKIARRDGCPQVERVIVTEPIEGAASEIVHPTQLGGTRHLSAAQFVHDQRNAIALVASQDGRFTVFAWSPEEDSVHAHRVETLLL